MPNERRYRAVGGAVLWFSIPLYITLIYLLKNKSLYSRNRKAQQRTTYQRKPT
jgi:hypothetical protein